MLQQRVSLHDVEDVDAFVNAEINKFCRPTSKRGGITLSEDERAELEVAGLEIMCKLARDYRPRMEGYAQDGRFSGYAAMFLPRKLGDVWHRMHPEHCQVTDPVSGKRRWTYGQRAASLQAVVDGGGEAVSEALVVREQRADMKVRLHKALYERWCEQVKVVVLVGELLSEGATPSDCAHMLKISPSQVKDAIKQIEPVIGRLESE